MPPASPGPRYAALLGVTRLDRMEAAAKAVGVDHALDDKASVLWPYLVDMSDGPTATTLLGFPGVETVRSVCRLDDKQRGGRNLPRFVSDLVANAVRRHLIAALDSPAPPLPSPVTQEAAVVHGPPMPASRAELLDWGARNNTGYLLLRPMREVRPHLHGSRRLADQFEGTVLTTLLARYVDTAMLYRAGLRTHEADAQVRALKNELWNQVCAQAALAPDARAFRPPEREALPDCPLPDHPDVALLVRKLREHLLGMHTWKKGYIPGAVELERRNGIRLLVRLDLGASVTLELGEHWRTGPLTFVVGWPREVPAVLPDSPETADAVRNLLDMCWLKAPPGKVAKLAEQLSLPEWRYQLDLLRKQQERADKERSSPEDVRLAWRLVEDGALSQVVPLVQKRLARGGWSSGTEASAAALLQVDLPHASPAERRALQVLALDRYGMDKALSHLVGHPRVTWAGERGVPVSVERAQVRMRVEPAEGGGWRLFPSADNLDADLLEQLLERVAGKDSDGSIALVSREQNRVVVADVPVHLAHLLADVRDGMEFPAEAAHDLVEFLVHVHPSVPVELPESLRGRELSASTVPVVLLTPLEATSLRLQVLSCPVAGGATYVPGTGPPEIHAEQDGQRVFARRDMEAERQAARALVAELALRADTEESDLVFALEDGEQAADAVAALAAMPPGRVDVRWNGDAWKVTRTATLKDLRVVVEKRRDWFGVAGGLDVDGVQVDMAVVLDAVRRRRRFIPVGRDRLVALDQQLRARLRDVAAGTFQDGKHVAMGPAAAVALHALGGDVAETRADATWSAFIQRMRAASTLRSEPPAVLTPVLRDYQREGFGWLARLSTWADGACLADDMGLGKTLQALALLVHRARGGPALVVAPTSVARTWVDQAARFNTGLNVRLWRQVPAGERADVVTRAAPGDVLVVSYGMLPRDLETLASRVFHTFILDEAQAVKNAQSQRAAAARTIQADFRVALTGTPLENHLGELWSLWRVVFPGLMGSWDQFRDRFATPIERNGDADRRQALAALCRPFLLRRTKAQVAPELPPRTEVTEVVDLSPAERRLYEQARVAAIASMEGLADDATQDRRFAVLAALTRLRLCACHPRLYDEKSAATSSKVNRLVELIGEIAEGGHRVLVFSQFTSLLGLVREELDRRGMEHLYLDGSTPAARRDELVARFQAGQGGSAFLVSLKAGGTGLTLTAATYVIHLDPWWNPAVEDQASDRAHRIGQERAVTIIRLVAARTVEEQILDLHADKRALVAGVLDGADVAARLDVDQMVSLLRRGWTGGDVDDDGSVDVPGTPPAPRTRITIEPAPAAVPSPAEPVPVPDAVATPAAPGDVPLPAWTGGSAARFQQHVDAFVADVEKRGGRTMGQGPCVKRFASTLVARARAGQEVELGPWLAVDTYQRDAKEGRVDVPAAEKKHTAAALAAFMKFLAQRTGA